MFDARWTSRRIRFQAPDRRRGSANRKGATSHSIRNGAVRNLPVVLVESDHKPLEAIFKKSLLNAPKRLQRMLLRLQRYEFEVPHKRGTSLLSADPLSGAYVSRKEATNDQEDVMTVSETRSQTEIEAEQVNMQQNLPVKDETLCQIQNLTQEDAILKTLAGFITQGWPDSKLRLQPEVQDYFPFKEELTLQNGVIFKGDRVVIPFEMRAELKRKLHTSCLGVQACQRRSREGSFLLAWHVQRN